MKKTRKTFDLGIRIKDEESWKTYQELCKKLNMTATSRINTLWMADYERLLTVTNLIKK